MLKRVIRGFAVIAALPIAAAGCDLDVVNTQAPDRERALSDPLSLQSLLAGGYGTWYEAVHEDFATNHLFPNLAGMNTTTSSFAAALSTREPRIPLDNSPDLPAGSGPFGPRNLFADMNATASAAYDALRAVRTNGVVFMDGEVDVTRRNEAYAKLIQGIAWGYLSLIFDQVPIIPETEELDDDAFDQIRESLVPYDQALEFALQSLEEAAQIAGANTFSFPTSATTRLWFNSPREITNADLAQIANTFAARLIVLNARTPQERAAADWNRVLDYTSKGLSFDLETTLTADGRVSWLYSSSQALIEVSAATICCYRLDYRVVGMADVSGNYQEWFASPLEERDAFRITTPDRRITGSTSTSNGSYVRYRSNHNGFNSAEGLYRRSFYQWGRHAIRNGASSFASGYNTGTAFLATEDENRLLRAEALLRTGNAQGAADLINVTRTRPQTSSGAPNLPPVTALGVPAGDTCVPRKDDGSCGSLMTALRYERMIELMNLDAIYNYADMRGFGMLPDGTFLNAPIPGNELDILQMPIYTFGGVGGESSAVYQPEN